MMKAQPGRQAKFFISDRPPIPVWQSCRIKLSLACLSAAKKAHTKKFHWRAYHWTGSKRNDVTAVVESSVSARRSSFYPWAVVLMLFPVALLNYLDRMMVATMRASIRADIPTIAND